MSVTGAPGDPPTRAGLPVGDLGGAMGGVIGVLAALVARERTGLGQHVDISMQDMQVSLLSYMATMYSLSGEAPAQMGNGHLVHVPYNTYRAADGWLIIAVVADQFWTALLSAVELPELDTEANRTSAGRRVHRDAIETRLRRALATRPRAHWLAALRAARVPCAPVRDIAEVMADPHLRARGMIAQVALPQGGAVQMPGNPIKLSGDAGSQAYASPPALGQHTDEVLRELLGKTDAELADLRARGVI
jgi:crotonobetainyl-CoA:carnitine CoA-transferase CaiB-like acyl-CoA transferase